MGQINIFVDLKYCIGCRTCEIACKQENNIPVGIKWINVIKVGPRVVEGKLKMDFVPMKCRHCARAPCIDACPKNAITKRTDGIVLINPVMCTGCTACLEACPFGVVQLNPEKQVAEKCTLCVHRIEAGLRPACVQHCPSQCMYLGELNDLMRIIQDKEAKRMVEKRIDRYEFSLDY